MQKKRYEELKFTEDFMFGKVMEDKGLCREVPDGIIIFLRTFDPFGMGKAKYVFRNICDTDGNLSLGDGTEKIFFNCICPLEEVPENLRALFDFIMNEKADDELTIKLATALNNARKNEEWRPQYMKELLHEDDVRTDAFAEGRSEGISEDLSMGRSEGLSQSRRETANNMYRNHFTMEQIALALNENKNVVSDWVRVS